MFTVVVLSETNYCEFILCLDCDIISTSATGTLLLYMLHVHCVSKQK